MARSSLRKISGPHIMEGVYEASGSLAGVVLGRRVVKHLTVRRLDGGIGETLAPLSVFRDLGWLDLQRISAVDLAPLAELELDTLQLQDTDALDISAIGQLASLRHLAIRNARDWIIPKPLRLPGSLRHLTFGNDRADLTGAEVKALIEAIDWRSAARLESLQIAVGGFYSVPPIEVDLGFLRLLPELRNLDIPQGVWHAGDRPSPLEPPFEGLSTRLGLIRIEAEDAAAVREALAQRIGEEHASVAQRQPFEPAPPEWAIDGPDEFTDHWSIYGSLCDLFERDGVEYQVEYDAAAEAERRLRAADPALAARLDFDQESSGTGIAARSREDLERAMSVIGIPIVDAS